MNITATKPLTYEDLQRASDALKVNTPPPPPTVIMSKKDFNFTMTIAKYYKGVQIIKRNRHTKNKKNRYKKTYTTPHMQVISDNCIESYGVKFYRDEYLKEN